ncbi:unnamed protein product, partial [Boreogadus saida]
QSAGPVAVAGRNVVVRPGEEVTLRGVESRAPEGATITSYRCRSGCSDEFSGGVLLKHPGVCVQSIPVCLLQVLL